MTGLSAAASRARVHAAQLPDYPRVSRVVLGLFCLYVVAWYIQLSYRIPQAAAIRFEFFLAALLSGLAAYRIITGASPGGPLGGLRVATAALFTTMLIALAISQDPATSWLIFNERVVQFAFMGVFIAVFVKSPTDLRWFLAAFLLACFRLGYEGFVGKITGNLVWENQGVMRLHGSTPLYAHPNSFAGNALGSLPFILMLFPHVPRWARVLLLIQLGFAMNVIIFTGSRTGYVGVMLLALYGVYRSKRRILGLTLFAAGLIVAAMLLPADYIERAKSIVTLEEKEGRSAETRVEILEDAWAIFLDHPLGVGVAAFPHVRMERFGRYQDTHNLYLEAATNLGVQGLVAFGVFIVVMFRLLHRTIHLLRDQERYLTEGSREAARTATLDEHLNDIRFMRATATAVELFIVVRLALGLFGMDLYEIYWWFALGLTVALWRIANAAAAKTSRLVEVAGTTPPLRAE